MEFSLTKDGEHFSKDGTVVVDNQDGFHERRIAPEMKSSPTKISGFYRGAGWLDSRVFTGEKMVSSTESLGVGSDRFGSFGEWTLAF